MNKTKKFFTGLMTFLLSISLLFCSCAKNENNKITDNTGSDTQAGGHEPTESQLRPGKKKIAITFDDGPHNVRTDEICKELEKYGFHATFFVIGNRVGGDDRQYRGGDTVKMLYEKGHEIGIHGYTHTKFYDKCTDEEYDYEINETLRAIKEYVPCANVTLMRPVGGRISEIRAKESEYATILWNVDSEDWKYKYRSDDSEAVKKEKVDKIVSNVMNNVSEGSIVLMHDIYVSTYDAVKIILAKLYMEGYEVVTVSELLQNVEKGRIYSCAD